MHKRKFIVSSFYKFVYLSNLEKKKELLKRKFLDFDLKGTFILGEEGINGSFSVKSDEFEMIKRLLCKLITSDINFKTQCSSSHSFLRLKIKLKKEIVTMGGKNVNPRVTFGKYLNPDSWDELLNKDDSIIIDTRNSYESEVGTFKNSLKTETKNFREFPEWVVKNKKILENKNIGIFCTGGIRCEKASDYMLKMGLKNVYQLKGGIIEYLKKTKNKNKFWKGECFVFDERVTLNESLERGSYTQCFACRSPITSKERKSFLFKPGVSCPKCHDIKTVNQKKRYEERCKQIEIAKKKKIRHLGS